MSLSVRAAIVIAAFCAASLAGSGTPGLAIELDRSLVITAPAADASGPLSSIPNVLAHPSAPAAPSSSTTSSAIDANQAPVIADDPAAIMRGAPAERRGYASLAAAVAAQAVPGSIDADLNCLAGAIYFESKGEPLDGQLAVAHVIINRMKSGRFPRSICAVITQPGQFSFVRGGRMPGVSTANPAYRTALAVAQVAMDHHWESPVASALFFHARHVAPGWRLTRVGTVGSHVFYR